MNQSAARDLLESVKKIVPLVRSESAGIEAAGHLTPSVHGALVERGVFRMWAPRSVGGAQVDLVTGLEVYETLGAADGATAWTVMLGSGAGRFAALLSAEAAEEIYGPADSFVAGSATPSGTARIVDGGYVVNGRWKYGSGSHHATWFTANCVVEDGAADDERPTIRAMAVPAKDVRVHPTWAVTAMRGTGSDDFEIEDVFVPQRHAFSVVHDSPRIGETLYRLPFASVAELAFGAVAAGIGRGALDSFAELARSKKPTGSSGVLADDPDVAARYGRAEAAVRGASVYLHHSAKKLWDAVDGGGEASPLERDNARLAAADGTARIAGAIDLLQRRAGMSPLYEESGFGRAWRDVHAATQNVVVAFERYRDVGSAILERGS